MEEAHDAGVAVESVRTVAFEVSDDFGLGRGDAEASEGDGGKESRAVVSVAEEGNERSGEGGFWTRDLADDFGGLSADLVVVVGEESE